MPGHGTWTNTEKRLLREALADGQSLYHASTVVGRSETSCDRKARDLGLWPMLAAPRPPGPPNAALSATEARIVRFLARRAPAIVAPADFASAFGFDYPEGMGVLMRSHVYNLRRKGIAIENRHGVGYWMTVEQAMMALAAVEPSWTNSEELAS